jgi:hypothetical protein
LKKLGNSIASASGRRTSPDAESTQIPGKSRSHFSIRPVGAISEFKLGAYTEGQST